MISKYHYEILYQLNLFGHLQLSHLVALTQRETKTTAARMLTLLREELIRQDGRGYCLTEEGELEIARAIDDPSLLTTAKAWIARARCGIDTKGQETRNERAACPSRIAPMDYYTVDMEGMIDLMREELSEYDD